MRSTHKRRPAELDREIAEILAKKPARHRRRGTSEHHATIRECPTWSPEATVEPLTEAKRQSAAEFERCYLVNLMQRAGTVSEAARLAGLDRTNFRRLLTRHGLRARD
jgi:transcriptional regulator with GAF, ATPase, and Fis domain